MLILRMASLSRGFLDLEILGFGLQKYTSPTDAEIL